MVWEKKIRIKFRITGHFWGETIGVLSQTANNEEIVAVS